MFPACRALTNKTFTDKYLGDTALVYKIIVSTILAGMGLGYEIVLGALLQMRDRCGLEIYDFVIWNQITKKEKS